ncbi:hypothetical protein EC55P2_00032 [Enterococcus phage EC55P2]|nr:hypothetical protein EC55P2_00032 [Enterococcus phage EC55P2]
MSNWIDACAIIISCLLSGLIGGMIERVRVFKVLDKAIDQMEGIPEKSVEYRLGYLEALGRIGQGVHPK